MTSRNQGMDEKRYFREPTGGNIIENESKVSIYR
jgi:hypothetical protein